MRMCVDQRRIMRIVCHARVLVRRTSNVSLVIGLASHIAVTRDRYMVNGVACLSTNTNSSSTICKLPIEMLDITSNYVHIMSYTRTDIQLHSLRMHRKKEATKHTFIHTYIACNRIYMHPHMQPRAHTHIQTYMDACIT